MLLDNTEQYDLVWNRVYQELSFYPYYEDREASDAKGLLPFRIKGKHAVYGIENMSEQQEDLMDDIILDTFLAVTIPGERLFALDWQHSAFLFDPRKKEEQQWVPLGIDPFFNRTMYAVFPGFYPNGDYCFFIDEQFRFGYLGHPWREEIWIFGDSLVAEFDKIYHRLGWIKIK